MKTKETLRHDYETPEIFIVNMEMEQAILSGSPDFEDADETDFIW